MTDKIVAPAKFGDEVLDYEWDWTSRLEEGESVVSVEITVSGNTALEVVNYSTNEDVTTFWVDGGGVKANRSGVINLLATTDSTPDRKIGEQLWLPVKAR